MKWKIPLFEIYWDQKDIEAVSRVIKRGSYWATGPEIKQLEQKVSDYTGMKYVLSFNSGTSALHADLLAHDITDGEVIVPSFTFIATANTVALCGAKPVFAEIEDETYGLDPEDVKEKITRKTRAIIPVHYGGGCCKNIKALKEIAEDKKIVLIEDAAESLGSEIGKEMVGSFGDSSMFSFCQNKIVTCGEGGVIVTNSKKIYDRLKLLRSHGRVENQENYFSTDKSMDYAQVGYNLRMSSISAALALSQMEKIDKIIKMRRKKSLYYNKKFSKNKNIKIPIENTGFYHVYQMYTIQLEDGKTRDKIQKNLSKAGVMTKVYFEPIHLTTVFRNKFGCKKGDLPLTEETSQKVLSLPIHPNINYEDIDYITDKIKT